MGQYYSCFSSVFCLERVLTFTQEVVINPKIEHRTQDNSETSNILRSTLTWKLNFCAVLELKQLEDLEFVESRLIVEIYEAERKDNEYRI